jgi:Flp pilus assembly pilin Flp
MQQMYAWTKSHFAALRANEKGQTMAEYGVVLALITVAVAAIFTGLGEAIIVKIGEVVGVLDGSATSES